MMIKTMIRLAFFSLQTALNNENCAIWIPENMHCFFHLILYITYELEKEKLNIVLLPPLPHS